VYPKQAKYNGSGDINAAANFTCVAPGPEQPGASTADLQSDQELVAAARRCWNRCGECGLNQSGLFV
jgi:hypothetical protein